MEQLAHSAPSYQSAFRIEGSGSTSLQWNNFEDKRGRLWQMTASVLANALPNSASLESYSVSHSINKQNPYSLLQSIYMPIYLCLYSFCLYFIFHVKCWLFPFLWNILQHCRSNISTLRATLTPYFISSGQSFFLGFLKKKILVSMFCLLSFFFSFSQYKVWTPRRHKYVSFTIKLSCLNKWINEFAKEEDFLP